MKKEYIKEIESIADYLVCNKAELVSEVSKLLDKVREEACEAERRRLREET